ncbi:MAG: type II toxin-antitoxin system VapC family toxin [Opitutales bacterium]
MDYLDTSVFLKLISHEDDSAFYRGQLQGKSDLYSSSLLRLEVRSALNRKLRQRFIEAKSEAALFDAQRLHQLQWCEALRLLREGAPRLVPIDDEIISQAESLFFETLPSPSQYTSKLGTSLDGPLKLTSLDAIHLASYRTQGGVMWTADRELRVAADRFSVFLGPLPTEAG